jgi:hypothetical protein
MSWRITYADSISLDSQVQFSPRLAEPLMCCYVPGLVLNSSALTGQPEESALLDLNSLQVLSVDPTGCHKFITG